MIWDAIRYGWTPTYFLTIEGIPVVWTEVSVPAATPAGFYFAPGLVIDRSAQVGQAVNRETGIGEGLPLTWHLLDDADHTLARLWVKRATAQTVLTDTVAAGDMTLPVESTAGFPSSGVVFVGLECISYASVSPGAFLGCVRGYGGSLPSIHAVGTAGAVVTDLPRYWRGRQVRLWVLPVEPGGTVICNAADLYADAVEVWRGVLDVGPTRAGTAFAFEAVALDRVLSNLLPAGASGTVLSTDYDRDRVSPADGAQLRIEARDSADALVWGYDLVVYPYSTPAWLSTAEQQAALQAEWDAQVANVSATADVGALSFKKDWGSDPVLQGQQIVQLGMWTAWDVRLSLPANSSVQRVTLLGTVSGALVELDRSWPGGLPAVTITLWRSGSRVMQVLQQDYYQGRTMLALALDGGADAVAAPGMVVVGEAQLRYLEAEVIDNTAWLLDVRTLDGQTWVPPKNVTGQQARILFSKTDSLRELALRMLESSGTGLRGPSDAWGHGEGYALRGGTGMDSAVDEASFTRLDLVGGAQFTVGGASASFETQLGGLLALTQMGCVARLCEDGKVRLAVVSTAPAGADYSAHLTDADLLTLQSEPVAQVQRPDPIGAVEVRLAADGKATGPSMHLREFSGLELGGRQLRFEVPLASGQQLGKQVTAWAASWLAMSSTLQVVELRVAPSVRARVGDLLFVTITHPAAWSWASGTPGYTGTARVVGQSRSLANGVQTLHLLFDGALRTGALCPSARVKAFTGTAGAPVTIDVPRQHLQHLQQALAISSPVRLAHYRPGLGNEGGGGAILYSAVTDTGTHARLTVSSYALGYDLAITGDATESVLTYPRAGLCNAYQLLYAHAGDGSVWS